MKEKLFFCLLIVLLNAQCAPLTRQLSRDIANDDPMAITWGPQREFFSNGVSEVVSWEDAQKVLLKKKLKGGKEYQTGWLTIYAVGGKQYLTMPPTPTAFREFARSRHIDLSGFAPE